MLSIKALLQFAAIGLYALTVASCIAAAIASARHKQIPFHARLWIVLALLFVAVAASRSLGLEAQLTDALRVITREGGQYGSRRSVQTPIVAALLVFGAGVGLSVAYLASKLVAGRRNIALLVALCASGMMCSLIVLRIVSLSPVDRLLYGPIKLNWLLDIGSTLMVAVAAAYYILVVKGGNRHKGSRSL